MRKDNMPLKSLEFRPDPLSLSHFLLKYLFIFFLSFMPSFAATQYVGCASLSPNNTTIQDAINAASDGDTVSICDGTYTENNIQITKNNLIIQGYGGNRDNVIVGASSSPIFSIQAASATIKNLTINSTSDNAYGITDNYQASGNHTFENLAIATKDNSIYLKNNSSAATFKTLSITSISGSGIYTEWNSDGAHSFSDISISAKNYGIYAVRGAGSFLNMTINSGDNAIYMGSKYPATFDTMALISTGAKGISVQNNTTALNSYTISNTKINSKSIGIDIAISGKNTIRDSNITSSNDRGINFQWDSNGAHELSNLVISAKDIGIYSKQGLGVLNNILLSSSNGDGIYVGEKYPISASDITVTQAAGKAFSINTDASSGSAHSFTDLNLTSKWEAFYVAKSGKLTIDDMNAASTSGDAISLAWDAQGAHEISNITVSAQNGSGIKAMHGLGLLTDFNITAKNYGVQAPSYEDLSIQRGYITTTNDKAIYVGNGDYKTLLVEDVVISAGNHAIQLDKSSSATINRVCVDNAVIGVRTEWDARDVTITNSNFDGNSDTGVQIASDPSYPATVTNSCFLKSPFANRNNTVHTFDDNYWNGTPPSGYDASPLTSCPVSTCYGDEDTALTPIADYRFDAWDIFRDGLSDRNISTKIVNQAFDLNISVYTDANKTAFEPNPEGIAEVRIINSTDSNPCPIAPLYSTVWQDINVTTEKDATFTVDRAEKEARVQLRFNGELTCSSDNFAIRPVSFDISAPNSYAGEDFNLSVFAVDGSDQNISGYDGNAIIDVNISDNSLTCINDDGNLTKSNGSALISTSFTYDSIKSSAVEELKFSDVGRFVVNFKDSTWTKVDSDKGECIDNSITTSMDADGKVGCNIENNITVKSNPYELNVTSADFTSSNGQDWLYMADVADMNVTASATVQANNKLHQPLQNFISTCYASDVDLSFYYDVSNPNTDANISYTPVSLGTEESLSDINKTLIIPASDFMAPSADVEYSFNVNRAYDTPLNPIDITLTDVKVTSTNVAKDENNATLSAKKSFYYGRINTKDVATNEQDINHEVKIEIYKSSTLSGFKQNSINWYQMKDDSLSGAKSIAIKSDFTMATDKTGVSISQSTANGVIDMGITNTWSNSDDAFIHLDVPSYLWYNRYSDYNASQDCATHPCFRYIYNKTNALDRINSGTFDGSSIVNDRNYTGTYEKSGVKTFR